MIQPDSENEASSEATRKALELIADLKHSFDDTLSFINDLPLDDEEREIIFQRFLEMANKLQDGAKDLDKKAQDGYFDAKGQ